MRVEKELNKKLGESTIKLKSWMELLGNEQNTLGGIELNSPLEMELRTYYSNEQIQLVPKLF